MIVSGSRYYALRVLHEHAAKTGRYDVLAGSIGDHLYPHLFDDPPHDLDVSFTWTALLCGHFTDSKRRCRARFTTDTVTLELPAPYEEFNSVDLDAVILRLLIGDTDGALDKLEAHGRSKYTGLLDQLDLERNSVYDPIRNEPAFIAVLDQYRENAAKQRQIMQSMNDDTAEL